MIPPAKMQSLSIPLIIVLFFSRGIAQADTITWSYSDGWNKGFVLTANSETSMVTIFDRTTTKEHSKPLHNPLDSLRYLEALTRRIKTLTVGQDGDDGPVNKITFANKEGTVERTIHDVSPPRNLFRHTNPYPAEAELGEADRFLREVDAFLLLSQLEALKNAYFEETNGEIASKTGTEPRSESGPEGENKDNPKSEVRPE